MVEENGECGRILTGRERSARFLEGVREAPQGSAADFEVSDTRGPPIEKHASGARTAARPSGG